MNSPNCEVAEIFRRNLIKICQKLILHLCYHVNSLLIRHSFRLLLSLWVRYHDLKVGMNVTSFSSILYPSNSEMVLKFNWEQITLVPYPYSTRHPWHQFQAFILINSLHLNKHLIIITASVSYTFPKRDSIHQSRVQLKY